MTKPSDPPLPRIAFTVAEAAQSAGLSEREVYRRCASGEIPTRKVGRRVLIRRSDLEDWLNKAGVS